MMCNDLPARHGAISQHRSAAAADDDVILSLVFATHAFPMLALSMTVVI